MSHRQRICKSLSSRSRNSARSSTVALARLAVGQTWRTWRRRGAARGAGRRLSRADLRGRHPRTILHSVRAQPTRTRRSRSASSLRRSARTAAPRAVTVPACVAHRYVPLPKNEARDGELAASTCVAGLHAAHRVGRARPQARREPAAPPAERAAEDAITFTPEDAAAVEGRGRDGPFRELQAARPAPAFS